MKSRQIAIIATLVALSVSTNYAMMSFANVKFMDFIVFVAGFSFGPVVGALTGIFSWVVYGTLNPLGFSLPIWFATMFSETVYGLGGALVKNVLSRGDSPRSWKRNLQASLFIGLFGVLLTLTYDVITNIVYGYVSNLNIVVTVVFGVATFGIVHMISNVIFFTVGSIPTITALQKVSGGDLFDSSDE